MCTNRILLIEDDENVRNLLVLQLSEAGFNVVTAEDGQIGFNLAVTEDFDLIITDINMPNWSGSENIYGLDLIDNKVKIIVISGYIEENLLAELKTYKNVVKILPKPFNTFELIGFVRNTLQISFQKGN